MRRPDEGSSKSAVASLADKLWDVGNVIVGSAIAPLVAFWSALLASESLRAYLINVHFPGPDGFPDKWLAVIGVVVWAFLHVFALEKCTQLETELRTASGQRDQSGIILGAVGKIKKVRAAAVLVFSAITILILAGFEPHTYSYVLINRDASGEWKQNPPLSERYQDPRLEIQLKSLVGHGWEIVQVLSNGGQMTQVLLRR